MNGGMTTPVILPNGVCGLAVVDLVNQAGLQIESSERKYSDPEEDFEQFRTFTLMFEIGWIVRLVLDPILDAFAVGCIIETTNRRRVCFIQSRGLAKFRDNVSHLFNRSTSAIQSLQPVIVSCW